MTQRKAPKTGYDFGNKRHYRRDIYAPIAKVLRHHRSSAQIMMMPSIEGDEIEVAMSKGFKQKNIHIVDQNSAIVATLKRRYPYVHTYGVEVRRALKIGAVRVQTVRGFGL